jgi:hypothetical protein
MRLREMEADRERIINEARARVQLARERVRVAKQMVRNNMPITSAMVDG